MPHVLIDLDGTLQDPAPGIVGSVQYALSGLGLPVPDASDLGWVIGPPLRVSFPQLGVGTDRIDEALRLYRQNYGSGPADGSREPAMYDAVVYDGIPAALDTLRAAGFRLVVATSKPHVFARPVIDRLGLAGHFAAVYGAELDGTRDDKADLIRHILDAEGIGPDAALMIGDRKYDLIGARKNSVTAIGVTWGYGSVEELREAGASTLCDCPTRLAAMTLKCLSIGTGR